MANQTWTDKYRLAPALPVFTDPPDLEYWGDLRDQAMDVIAASARLEGAVSTKTAEALGDHLRLMNSFHSNLIEGHKTFIPDIEKAMSKEFSGDNAATYAQELCAAHVRAEKEIMRAVLNQSDSNVSHPEFIQHVHQAFYSHLPDHHQYTHEETGFTTHPINAGVFRNHFIGVNRGTMPLGPTPEELPDTMKAFGRIFDPGNFRSEEKLLAAAVGHLKLAWIHPFSDGNGRTVRLYSGFFLARCGINRSNLWSLSRGFSHNKAEYMGSLFAGDPQPLDGNRERIEFQPENVAMFAKHFLDTCHDQIHFMGDMLSLRNVSNQIDAYVAHRSAIDKTFRPETGRLLRAIFTNGEMTRPEAYGMLETGAWSQKTAQRIVTGLLEDGLLRQKNSRSPLSVGLPPHALPIYFPKLYDVATVGADKMKEYMAFKGKPSREKE